MASKTDNRFKTGFSKPITGLPKKTYINIPSSLYLRNDQILITKTEVSLPWADGAPVPPVCAFAELDYEQILDTRSCRHPWNIISA